jgi:hypothetical protein
MDRKKTDWPHILTGVLFLVALILLGLLMGCDARAEPKMELLGGQCQLDPRTQGSWWRGETFNVGPMKASCFQVGVSDKIRRGLGWRVSYVDLGELPLTEEAIGGPGPQPHWTAQGTGAVKGATLGLYLDRPFMGTVASIEGGAFVYRSEWSATAYHAASGYYNHASPSPHTGAAFYIGAGLSYNVKDFSATASVRVYPNLQANAMDSTGDAVGPTRATGVALVLGLQRSF